MLNILLKITCSLIIQSRIRNKINKIYLTFHFLMEKKILTLIGRKQAKIGYIFTFLRPPNKECENCKLYKICIGNLKEGQSYEIVAIRNKIHDCPVHQDGAQIVEVKEKEIVALIESNIAFKSAIITFHPPNCGEFSCSSFEKCNTNLQSEEKYKIIEILGVENCKLRKKLKLAKLKYIGKT